MARYTFKKGSVTWVYVNQPTTEDFEYIKASFRFHPIILNAIAAPTLHPAIEAYKTHLFLILHFPLIYRTKATNIAAEIDFLITKKLLITITYKPHPKFEEFFKKISKDAKFQRRFLDGHTGKLVYGIIDWLLTSLISDLDFIEEQITHIEEKIFTARRPSLVEEISHTRRDILDFKRMLAPLQTVLKLLPEIASNFYGQDTGPYFTNLLVNESKIRHLIENHKETIEALHETNESLLSNRISKIITVLTIFSAVIMPLNLLASVWGMNHAFLPLRDGPYDFWIVVGIMISTGLFLALLFRLKRWL